MKQKTDSIWKGITIFLYLLLIPFYIFDTSLFPNIGVITVLVTMISFLFFSFSLGKYLGPMANIEVIELFTNIRRWTFYSFAASVINLIVFIYLFGDEISNNETVASDRYFDILFYNITLIAYNAGQMFIHKKGC